MCEKIRNTFSLWTRGDRWKNGNAPKRKGREDCTYESQRPCDHHLPSTVSEIYALRATASKKPPDVAGNLAFYDE